jgi:hypothetical protein
VLESPDHLESARTILDPIQLDPSGGTAIDFYVPSRDGKYVAVSLSKGGSESGDVHVYETATGKSLPDVAFSGSTPAEKRYLDSFLEVGGVHRDPHRS